MEKFVLFSGNRRRHFDSPATRDHILAIGGENLIEVVTPELLPHCSKFGITRQRSAFRRLQRPVFAGSPPATEIVAGSVEFISRASLPGNDSILRQKRVHHQLSRSFAEAESLGVAKIF